MVTAKAAVRKRVVHVLTTVECAVCILIFFFFFFFVIAKLSNFSLPFFFFFEFITKSYLQLPISALEIQSAMDMEHVIMDYAYVVTLGLVRSAMVIQKRR
jgi:hypothetical protein